MNETQNRVLCVLSESWRFDPRTDVPFPRLYTQKGISAATGISKPTVRRVTLELELLGFVSKTPFRVTVNGEIRTVSAFLITTDGREEVERIRTRVGRARTAKVYKGPTIDGMVEG